MIVGIIGKPNVGKSTFFNASTFLNVPIANYPFTTIEPNFGVAYVSTKCVCRTLGVKDKPINSQCVNGIRFIPIKIIDIAGIVKGASQGRGLGNKFLDNIRQANALIHVIDASGLTNEEGIATSEVSSSPIKDIEFVENEFDLWLRQIIQKDWRRISKSAESNKGKIIEMIAEKLSGLAITKKHIRIASEKINLSLDKIIDWNEDNILKFCTALREVSKPSIIAANKIDKQNVKGILKDIKDTGRLFVPCASEAELLLRKAADKKLIDYLPGDSNFSVIKPEELSTAQVKALEMVRENVLNIWGSTGVQATINSSYLELLQGIVVYPVEDEHKLSDKKGNILPDAYILQKGSSAKDLAFTIHNELGKTFLHAIDVKTGLRLGADYILNNFDVIKIVSTSRRG
ncbi:redox-regulated ATPase YchF [Thermoproteota archaeon]